MTWQTARASLDAKLTTLAGINTAQIAWPNVAFTPTPGTLWYKVSFIPTTVAPEIGSGNVHEKGVYQVSVFAPSGVGMGAGLTVADNLVALFNRVTLTGGVHCGVPVLGSPLQEPDWIHIPVQVPFQIL